MFVHFLCYFGKYLELIKEYGICLRSLESDEECADPFGHFGKMGYRGVPYNDETAEYFNNFVDIFDGNYEMYVPALYYLFDREDENSPYVILTGDYTHHVEKMMTLPKKEPVSNNTLLGILVGFFKRKYKADCVVLLDRKYTKEDGMWGIRRVFWWMKRNRADVEDLDKHDN